MLRCTMAPFQLPCEACHAPRRVQPEGWGGQVHHHQQPGRHRGAAGPAHAGGGPGPAGQLHALPAGRCRRHARAGRRRVLRHDAEVHDAARRAPPTSSSTTPWENLQPDAGQPGAGRDARQAGEPLQDLQAARRAGRSGRRLRRGLDRHAAGAELLHPLGADRGRGLPDPVRLRRLLAPRALRPDGSGAGDPRRPQRRRCVSRASSSTSSSRAPACRSARCRS